MSEWVVPATAAVASNHCLVVARRAAFQKATCCVVRYPPNCCRMDILQQMAEMADINLLTLR